MIVYSLMIRLFKRINVNISYYRLMALLKKYISFNYYILCGKKIPINKNHNNSLYGHR